VILEKELPSRGFTKLDSGIIYSTLWTQSHDTLRVWIALLALCDAQGRVRSSIPALSHLCFITVERMNEILTEFQSPDLYSRIKDHKGRKIKAVEGGWVILNYLRYRNLMQRKALSHAERQKRYREKHKCKKEVTANVTRDAEAEAEAEAESRNNASHVSSTNGASSLSNENQTSSPIPADHQKLIDRFNDTCAGIVKGGKRVDQYTSRLTNALNVALNNTGGVKPLFDLFDAVAEGRVSPLRNRFTLVAVLWDYVNGKIKIAPKHYSSPGDQRDTRRERMAAA
jgi:hypothetical protein